MVPGTVVPGDVEQLRVPGIVVPGAVLGPTGVSGVVVSCTGVLLGPVVSGVEEDSETGALELGAEDTGVEENSETGALELGAVVSGVEEVSEPGVEQVVV